MKNNIVGLDLNIDKDYLEEAVRQTVIMGISESLNGKNEIVSQVVRSVLGTKVNSDGRISSYASDNKYSLLDYYVKNLLETETQEVIKEVINEQRDGIRKIIKESIKKRDFSNEVVNAIMNGMVDQLSKKYYTKVDLTIHEKEDTY